jgi:hypothetical protein
MYASLADPDPLFSDVAAQFPADYGYSRDWDIINNADPTEKLTIRLESDRNTVRSQLVALGWKRNDKDLTLFCKGWGADKVEKATELFSKSEDPNPAEYIQKIVEAGGSVSLTPRAPPPVKFIEE